MTTTGRTSIRGLDWRTAHSALANWCCAVDTAFSWWVYRFCGFNGFMLSSPIFADSDLGRYTTVDQVHWLTTLDSIPYQPVDKTGKNASSVNVYPAHNPMAYVQQYNTNVQTELKKILVEVGFVGTRGVHLSYGSYNLNAIPVTLAPQAQGQFISALRSVSAVPAGG